jgi:hypothetical protein
MFDTSDHTLTIYWQGLAGVHEIRVSGVSRRSIGYDDLTHTHIVKFWLGAESYAFTNVVRYTETPPDAA